MATPSRFLLLTLTLSLLTLPLKAGFNSGDSELRPGDRMDSGQYLLSPEGEWALIITETRQQLYVRFKYKTSTEDKKRWFSVPRLCVFRHLHKRWEFAGYVDSGPDLGKWFRESQQDQFSPECYLTMTGRGVLEFFMNLGTKAGMKPGFYEDKYVDKESDPRKVWQAALNHEGTKLVLTDEGIVKTLHPTNPQRTTWKEDGWHQGPFFNKAPKNAPKAPENLAKVP